MKTSILHRNDFSGLTYCDGEEYFTFYDNTILTIDNLNANLPSVVLSCKHLFLFLIILIVINNLFNYVLMI